MNESTLSFKIPFYKDITTERLRRDNGIKLSKLATTTKNEIHEDCVMQHMTENSQYLLKILLSSVLSSGCNFRNCCGFF